MAEPTLAAGKGGAPTPAEVLNPSADIFFEQLGYRGQFGFFRHRENTITSSGTRSWPTAPTW